MVHDGTVNEGVMETARVHYAPFQCCYSTFGGDILISFPRYVYVLDMFPIVLSRGYVQMLLIEVMCMDAEELSA